MCSTVEAFSTMGVFSTVGDIMSTMGVILSTVEGTQYHGVIMMCMWISWVPRGCSVSWGRIFCYLSTPWYWTPHVTHDYPPHVSWYPPWLNIQKMVPPPPWYWTPPQYSRYSYMHHDIPTVFSITHSTQDNPHSTHDILHGTEHPHGTQDIPTFIMISPHSTQGIPYMHHDIPHGIEHPPRYCTHTLYRVIIVHLPLRGCQLRCYFFQWI